jgi:hypothetical protein
MQLGNLMLMQRAAGAAPKFEILYRVKQSECAGQKASSQAFTCTTIPTRNTSVHSYTITGILKTHPMMYKANSY